MVACCNCEMGALIAAPPSPVASSAVVRHSRLPRAGVGHSRLSAPSPPPPQVFAVPGLRFPPANAPRLRQSSPSPALVLPLAATGHSRACFRSAPPRSWRGCPPVSHAAASRPPTTGHNFPANAPVPATAPTVSIPPTRLACGSRLPSNVPDSELFAFGDSSAHAARRISPHAKSRHNWNRLWLAQLYLQVGERNKSWLAPARTHSRSPWENESPPGRSPLVTVGAAMNLEREHLLPLQEGFSRSPSENESPPSRSPLVRPTSAPVPSSWLHPRFASGRRQPAVRLRGHSGPAVRLILPGCAPWARVRDGSGENNRLLLPHLPFRALVRGYKIPMRIPNAIETR